MSLNKLANRRRGTAPTSRQITTMRCIFWAGSAFLFGSKPAKAFHNALAGFEQEDQQSRTSPKLANYCLEIEPSRRVVGWLDHYFDVLLFFAIPVLIAVKFLTFAHH